MTTDVGSPTGHSLTHVQPEGFSQLTAHAPVSVLDSRSHILLQQLCPLC